MRRSWLAAAIVALIVLNVWRWWPTDATARPSADARQATANAQDLRLAVRASSDEVVPRVERNIFQVRKPVQLRVEPRIALSRAAPPAPAVLPQTLQQEPPARTPEEIDADAVQAELAQIKLVGVIFRDAKPRAYFARGDQTYMVSLGDTVERFTVTEITAERARLHDPRTRIGRTIPVLGK